MLPVKMLKRTSLCAGALLTGTFLLCRPVTVMAGAEHTSVVVQALVKVSGKVTDEKGNPLPGVSVAVKNGSNVVVTDSEGHFVINVEEGAVLVLSSAGFSPKEVKVSGSDTLNIVLKEDIQALDEVVSIGYQKLRKSDLTGAVSSVKANELNLSTPTLSQALVGKVAGVQVSQVSGAPNAGAKIRVRGIGSINASSEPLYVIDGYAVGGNQSAGPGNGGTGTGGFNPNTNGNDIFINPDDIESIEVLKDAASAAIYGSRAAAGVVLITTKRGKLGKGRLEYHYQLGVHQLAKKVELMNGAEFAQMFIDGRNGNYKNTLIANGVTWNDAFYSDDNATRIAKGGGNSSTILKSIYDFANQKMIQPEFNTDWQDALYRSALVQRHNLSFSGGKDGVRYALSGGYQDQPGIITATFQKRINFRANVDAEVNKKLSVGASMAFTNTDGREVQEGRFNQGPILGALVMMPIFPVYNTDGSLQLGRASERTDGYQYAFQTIENPVALAQKVNITRKGIRGTYNGNAVYKILPDLSAKVNLGLQTYNEKYEYFYPTTLSSGVNPPGSAAAIAAARASAQTINTLDRLAEFTLNYQKQFGKHHINALAGYSAQETTSDIVSVEARNFSNDLVPEITAQGAAAGSFLLQDNTGKAVTTLVSYFSRVMYNFDDRYFASASIRADGSSRFGPQNRFGTFPSVSGGWNISNESFYNNWLGAGSTLKLRASWGLSGNNNIGNYRYEQLLAQPGGTVIGENILTAIWAQGITDDKLGWESTSQYNIGTDVTLLNGRIGAIFNYYVGRSFNLLYGKSVSAISGARTVLTNLKNSDIRNHGFDLQVDAKVIRKKDFSFNFSGNITANRNEVKSLDGASALYNAGAERSYTTHVTREGNSIGMFYGFRVAGMVRESDMANIAADDAVYRANNNAFPKGYVLKGPARSNASSTPLAPGDLYFVDVNGDGVVTDADKDVIGSPYPDFTYGFNLSFNYKHFDLSASFNGSHGNEVLDGQDYYIRNMEGSGNQYKVLVNRYRSEAEPGNGHDYRASRGGTQSNSTRLSDYYLQDGTYFRCTNITIGFNMPVRQGLKKAGLSSVRIYGGIDNAFTITNYLGYNPEVDYNNGSNLTPGVDYGKYPLVRAFNCGVRMAF
ncbi:TonB-dependent receptor [Parasegetibacter sp. NRK P23]|uniref:SusC/RagA family TonB-linked outer membrane protein n=1 Tax=Parasegetibacter sp. NRK P23 TaxID=2942999 RepID=UPI002043D6AC|nr:TonB-dependent receptor [Parasegetibacter sp. NRK P23]MCM5529061.1 TonB-dependent receptor [Parasegetibacter sp. NRK P23]